METNFACHGESSMQKTFEVTNMHTHRETHIHTTWYRYGLYFSYRASFFKKKNYRFIWERGKLEAGGGAEWKGERELPADPTLSVAEPDVTLDLITLRSWLCQNQESDA